MASVDICKGDAKPMKEFMGVFLAVIDERRHELAMIIVSLICIAAVWAMLLVWTQ